MDTIIDEANRVYKKNFPPTTCFERAIFFSWGCTIGDCTFCYMSTQPENKKATESRRSNASLIAETILSKRLGWEIGFFSGGTGALLKEELLFLLKIMNEILEEKVWINIGSIPKSTLELFKPYIKGVVGSIETINPELHKKVCPSKPTAPYEKMFDNAKDLGLDRAMTFIVGLGETHDDFDLLKEFIKKYGIIKIHVYSLIPHKDTSFENSSPPTAEDQAWWIANLRITFPKLDIQCGIWEDRVERISTLLNAGANSISKFKATKLFGTDIAKEIENQAEIAGRTFEGTLTRLPDVNWDEEVNKLSVSKELKEEVKIKLNIYLKTFRKNVNKVLNE